MSVRITFLAVLLSISAYAQQSGYQVDALVKPLIREQVLSVGGPEADVPGYHRRAIQMAIDAVATTGGTVLLDRGTFELNAPVHMRSNVRLVGTGKATVLKKSQGFQTNFIVDADYAELKITVENPEGFEPGMKIQVTDSDNSGCWNVSTAYITHIEDNVIYIDDYLIRDYRSDKNGLVSNASSVIEIIDAENVLVSNLTADGNRENNFKADGCNGAGILVLKSKNVTIDNVHVKDFNGEGISWQITERVTVKNCEISGSGNIGLHPGTGSPLSVIENNDVHDNDVDGLFICWRVHHSLVKGNKFHNNGRFGICTGHKDTDVLFEENHIYENASDGVHLRHERESNAPHRNTFYRNIIENNGTEGGGYGISINSNAQDLVLRENTIRDTGTGIQKAAVYVYENGAEPQMDGNEISGHALSDEILFD